VIVKGSASPSARRTDRRRSCIWPSCMASLPEASADRVGGPRLHACG
jgi:hypothetical protein